jgi:hypothetical protein
LSGKKIPDLSLVPNGTPATQLSLETAREISPGVWAGESERIKASDFVALLAASGASLSVNITSLLNDRGTYSPSATYTRYDFVAYGGGHYAYVNGTPGSGNAPPNATYWVLISVDGKSAIATITDATPAPIPAVGLQATYGVDSSAGMVIGQIVGIGAASTLSVVATPTTSSITVQNVNAAVGPVATGAKIAPAGKKGDPGLNSTVPGPAGAPAFTTVSLGFTIPPYNTQLSITVESTAFMAVDMALQISGKFFRVHTAPTNATTVVITNTVQGQTGQIAQFAKVAPAGETGPAGISSGGVGGLQYTYIGTVGTPSAGQIRSADINSVGLSTVSISATDAQSTPQSTADVLARLKVGAIIEIAASNANKVRGTISANYSSGTNSFDWSGQVVSGSIANNVTVYLSIISDPVSAASGGGHVIRDEGIDLPQRGKIDFVGSGVTATDDAAGDRTVVTIAASSGSSITWQATTDTAVNAIEGNGYIATGSSGQRFTLSPNPTLGQLFFLSSTNVGTKEIVGGQILLPSGASDFAIRNQATAPNASIDLICTNPSSTPKKWLTRALSDVVHWELFDPSGYDSDAITVFTAIESILTTNSLATNLLTTPIRNAINNRVVAKKANSTWASTVAYYGFVGGAITANATAAAAIDSLNFRTPGTFSITWGTVNTFTRNSLGVASNGTQGRSDTGIEVTKTLFPDSGWVFGFYNTAAITESDVFAISGSANQHHLYLTAVGLRFNAYASGDSDYSNPTTNLSRQKNFKAGIRINSTQVKVAIGSNLSSAFSSTASAASTLGPLYLFSRADNNFGTTASMGAFWHNSSPWSDSQIATEQTDEVAYQTALSRA